MLVVDAMTPEPVTIGADRSTKEAMALLLRHGVTALPVVDAAGDLVGIVSETDLIRAAVPPDPRAHLRSPGPDPTAPHLVEEVLTEAPLTARVYDDVAATVATMVAANVKSLPVLDAAGRLVGIVSRSDVLRLLARPDGVIAAEIHETLRTAGEPDWRVSVADGVVTITGPERPADRSLATSVAHTVPGVVEVRTT